jgi:hypothetical protein
VRLELEAAKDDLFYDRPGVLVAAEHAARRLLQAAIRDVGPAGTAWLGQALEELKTQALSSSLTDAYYSKLLYAGVVQEQQCGRLREFLARPESEQTLEEAACFLFRPTTAQSVDDTVAVHLDAIAARVRQSLRQDSGHASDDLATIPEVRLAGVLKYVCAAASS